jgi:hypothetical protein
MGKKMKMKKLELNPNEKKILELRSDQPKTGKSSYGDYYLYTVKNGTGEDYSFFAPNEKVHEALKDLKRGIKFEITKTAKQSGKEIKVDYEVNVLEAKNSELPPPPPTQDDFYYTAMEKSFSDAIRIQNKFNGMANVNQLAVTIYISRLKQSPSYDG